MVTVTALEWLSAPDVPVTMTVAWDPGVGVLELLDLLPPHPSVNKEASNSRPSKLIPTVFLRVNSFPLRVVKIVPNKPSPGSSNPMCVAVPYPFTGGIAAAEMVKVEEAVLDPGEMTEGFNLQVNPPGATQVSVI